MLLYHHCIPVSQVVYQRIFADRSFTDQDFKDAVSWLERKVGFYPLFLAVGSAEEDIRMTGYHIQWARIAGTEITGKAPDGHNTWKHMLKKSGEHENYALFSFEHVDGIFTDYDYWHCVLNSSHCNYLIPQYIQQRIFKPSWKPAGWFRKAEDHPHTVQLVSESLDLPDAKRVWVRNKEAKRYLQSLGFSNVEVHRISLEGKTNR